MAVVIPFRVRDSAGARIDMRRLRAGGDPGLAAVRIAVRKAA